jgi:dimethylamine monooxygenase subunit A
LWRLNWSILDDPALFQPAGTAGSAPGARRLDELTLRVERQTLRRLPRTGAVLFTIRTYRHRLEDVARDPQRARDLAATLRTCPADRAAYKGWTGLLTSLIDTLEAAPDEQLRRDTLRR